MKRSNFQGRDSTRPGRASSTRLLGSESNSSRSSTLSTLSNATQIPRQSSDGLHQDPIASTYLISAGLMSIGLHSSPGSTPCPDMSSFASAGANDGQFSDAETDENDEMTRQKRRKVDGEPLKNLPVVIDIDISNEAPISHGCEEPVPLPPSVVPSKPTQPPRASPAPALRQFESGKNLNQVPIETRKLASLVGIPESSQAIIESTISLPSNSKNRHVDNPAKTTNKVIARTPVNSQIGRRSRTSTPALSVSGQKPSISNGNRDPSLQDRVSLVSLPDTISTSSLSIGAKGGPTATAKYQSSAKTCQTSRSQEVHKSESVTMSSSSLEKNRSDLPVENFLGVESSPQESAALGIASSAESEVTPTISAPRFGQSLDAPGGFTMPAPGTFSIRAPCTASLLSALESSCSPDATDLTESICGDSRSVVEALLCGTSDLVDLRPGSTPSVCDSDQVFSPPTPSHNALETSKSAGKQAPKRKAQTSRKKASARNTPEDESTVKLVRPPLTINGKVSHSRKVPPGYIKRTPNSFIMFRSHVIAHKLLPPGVESDNRQISRVVSGLWAGLSEDDLRTWQTASRELRAAARAKNPNATHIPQPKRKEIIRRRNRVGQLPGETPEQQAARERAAAAALAKVIMEARGEPIDQERMMELAALKTQDATQQSDSSSRIIPREESRPEFRAPSSGVSLGTTTGLIACSEYAESTLTTSPGPEVPQPLSCVPESEIENSHPVLAQDLRETKTNFVSHVDPSLSIPKFQDPISLPGSDQTSPLGENGRCINQPGSTTRPEVAPSEPCPKPAQNYSQPGDLDFSVFCNLFDPQPGPSGSTSDLVDVFSDEILRTLGFNFDGLGSIPDSSGIEQSLNTSGPETSILGTKTSEVLSQNVSDIWYPDPSITLPELTSNAITNSQVSGSAVDDANVFPFDQLSQLSSSGNLDLSSLISQSLVSTLK